MITIPSWLRDLLPILLLLGVIALVLKSLPQGQLGHSESYRHRRFRNWFPLGLTYAFLYMGRYNLTVSKNALPEGLMTNADFGTIFGVGATVYGLAFIINGPLTDRWGGRATILIAAIGAAVMNVLMGVTTLLVLKGWWHPAGGLVSVFVALYGANMYFQSFGAVSIVKVNAAWFHVRERGIFGGIFGILISLGIYFAFDWGRLIVTNAPVWWVFFVPATILVMFAALDYYFVFDKPSDVGHPDFDTADASSGDDGPHLSAVQVFGKMLTSPVILTIAAVEFCSGFLRNGLMHWYSIFAKQTGLADTFVARNWGLLQCVAGILGGMIAGLISDRVFQSRRGPVAAVLYAVMLVGSIAMVALLDSALLGVVVVVMMLAIIGVHGMLSGTASMDFGGKKNAGTVVGIIDGMVYAGTALQSFTLGALLPQAGGAASVAANWIAWPLALAPMALVGLVLASRVWNAKPQPKRAPRDCASGALAPPVKATSQAT